MTQKPRKSDFGELKEKKIDGVYASDPPRSLRYRRSFWKTVSIYPRSAPAESESDLLKNKLKIFLDRLSLALIFLKVMKMCSDHDRLFQPSKPTFFLMKIHK